MKTRVDIWEKSLSMIEEPLRQVSNPDGAGSFLTDAMDDIVEVIKAEIEREKSIKIGTIEPVYKSLDKENIAFIVGAIKKYADRPELHYELVEYLKKRIGD